ncbi:hypothetical protein QY97_03247 [Bacillus thermotolerans]|nr:hypothetical protein QY97_03247 [Bacillus thermotolerans]
MKQRSIRFYTASRWFNTSGWLILLIKSSVNGQTVKKYVESPQNT